eukprot:2342612-Pyramimonas_sp.AAC.1
MGDTPDIRLGAWEQGKAGLTPTGRGDARGGGGLPGGVVPPLARDVPACSSGRHRGPPRWRWPP